MLDYPILDFPNLRRVFVKSTQNVPIFLPAFYAGGILTAPRFPKLEQDVFYFLQGHGGVDFLQVSRYFFDILPADKVGRSADLMDDTALQTALGVHRLDGLHHTAQAIGTKQIYVQNSPGFEAIQHILFF